MSKKVGVILSGRSSLESGARGNLIETANRVHQVLEENEVLPTRKSDLSVIGDLAALSLNVRLLDSALRALLATKRSKAGKRTLEDRLMDLVGQVDDVYAISRDIRRPLKRILKQRCGSEGEIEATLRSLTISMEGVGIDTTHPKKKM